MTKLTKVQLKERDELIEKLTDKQEVLEAAVIAFNEAVEAAWEGVIGAMDEYNEAITEANAWRQDIAGEIGDYIDGKSDKWQESDRAAAYESWREAWQEDLDVLELEKPEEFEAEIESPAELMGATPEEVEA